MKTKGVSRRVRRERKRKPNEGIIILSTFPEVGIILRAAKELILNKKVCACVNIVRVRSLYVWNEKLEDHDEYIVLFKTTKRASAIVKAEIRRIHPYQVPEIVELKMNDVSESYLSWLIASTTRSDSKIKLSKDAND